MENNNVNENSRIRCVIDFNETTDQDEIDLFHKRLNKDNPSPYGFNLAYVISDNLTKKQVDRLWLLNVIAHYKFMYPDDDINLEDYSWLSEDETTFDFYVERINRCIRDKEHNKLEVK